MRWWQGIVLFPALGLSGCLNNQSSSDAERPPTLIEVDPARFSGASCNPLADASAGSLQRYVATLIDVTPEDSDAGIDSDHPVLPSSPPVSCERVVSFGFVVPGRRYIAQIDGYDTVDLEAAATGNRLMLDHGNVISPRWQAVCGGFPVDGATGTLGQNPTQVTARSSATVRLVNCSPFVDHFPSRHLGSAVVAIADLLGATLSCGDVISEVSLRVFPAAVTTDPSDAGRDRDASASGQDASVVSDAAVGDAASPEAGAAPPTTAPDPIDEVSTACGEDVRFSDLEPGAYVIQVEAFGPEDAGRRASYLGECSVTVEAGAEARAQCAPLTPSP